MPRGKDRRPRRTENYGKRHSDETKTKLALSIKASRETEKEIQDEIDEYSLVETQQELLRLLPWTQGTNRKIFKDKRLYKTIMSLSAGKVFFSDKISEKIYQILYPVDNVCPHCGSSKKFTSMNLGYSKFCKNFECSEGRDELKQEFSRVQKLKWDSLNNGEKETRLKKTYTPELRNRLSNSAKRRISEYKFSKSSKSANDFFKILLEHGFNGECDITSGERRFIINTDKEKKTIFVDFCFRYKIIEYDGDYWHKNRIDIDKERDNHLTEIGFSVLRIKHSEVKNNINQTIDKAIKFLSCH
jgi:hypothetical protein